MHNTVSNNFFNRFNSNSKLGIAKERIHILEDRYTEVTQARMQTMTKKSSDEWNKLSEVSGEEKPNLSNWKIVFWLDNIKP